MQPNAELIQCLSATTGISFSKSSWTPLSGGSINQVFHVVTQSGNQYCCKLNDASKFPQLFASEVAGLQQLAPYIKVPHVMGLDTCGNQQVLLLEWIETSAPDAAFWKKFGEALARLHQVKNKQFGWHQNNYMGALPQANPFEDDWCSFFANNRLLPLGKQSMELKLLTTKEWDALQKLCLRLHLFFPNEEPCMVHGDLWSGNFLCGKTGQPVLIDPATHFAIPAVDLALTTLFGGFAPAFYEAYNYHSPLPANYREQWEICTLYPLLVHLLLFGRSYHGQVADLLRRYSS